MSRPLPRYLDSDPHEWERKLGRILLATGETAPTATVVKVTLAGDTRRLRGLPAVARGVSGVSPGTDPMSEVLRSIR